MTTKLYYAPFTRSSRPRWLLEELGVPYELVRIDMKAKEHKSPAYLKLHPHGSVPALDDDGVVLIESAAICAYLAEKHAAQGLGPKDLAERGQWLQWLFYAMATLEGPTLQAWGARKLEDDVAVAKFAEARLRLDVALPYLDRALAAHQFLVGDRFTAADVVVASMLVLLQPTPLLDEHPAVKDYVARMKARPAFSRARAD